MRFQDSNQFIQIEDDNGQAFTCPSAQFLGYEETYQAVTPSQARVWTIEVQCLTEGGTQHVDLFYTMERFALYLSKIAAYQALFDEDNEPTPPTFAEQQAAALSAWNLQVNQFISQFFDVGTQISFVKLYIQSEAARPLITQVDAWVMQVMAYYYQIKQEIQTATTLDGLHQLQEIMEFESLFGVQGSLLTVPDVHLAQFF